MRLLLFAIVTFSLGSGATLAQTGNAGSPPSGAVADVTKASELAPKNTPKPITSAPAPRKPDAVTRMKGDESKEGPEISQGPVSGWPPWDSYGKK
jgi:hypothetical protein